MGARPFAGVRITAMFPMDHQLGPVAVEYDAPVSQALTAGRIVKHFTNAYAARCFYGVKDKQGRNPQVIRSEDTMSPQVISEASVETTTEAPATKAVKPTVAKAKKPAPKKAPSAKAPAKVKKVASKAKAEKAVPKEKKVRTPTVIIPADPKAFTRNQLAFLTALKGTVKNQKELNASEIEAKAVGHACPAWKYLRELGEAGLIGTGIETRPQTYYITAKGMKALGK